MVRAALVVASLLLVATASAEPYFAVKDGQKCANCHVSASGGGMRNIYGNVYSSTILPHNPLGTPGQGVNKWNGKFLKYLKLGANLRGSQQNIDVPGRPDSSEWDVRWASVYFAIEPIENKLLLYTNQDISQGEAVERETWLQWNISPEIYVRGGKFFLPFGWRLQDDNAFVRQVSGISMTTPDTGIELGLETDRFSGQLAVTRGTAGGPEVDDGKQISLSGTYIEAKWRAGASISYNNADAGDRRLYAIYGGIRTGPVTWLAEIDYVVDFGFPEGRRNQIVSLLEGNWQAYDGLNVKVTYEYLVPDDSLDENERNRVSAVVEYTPIQFLQLRGGYRDFNGIPQSDVQNRSELFLELHAFF